MFAPLLSFLTMPLCRGTMRFSSGQEKKIHPPFGMAQGRPIFPLFWRRRREPRIADSARLQGEISIAARGPRIDELSGAFSRQISSSMHGETHVLFLRTSNHTHDIIVELCRRPKLQRAASDRTVSASLGRSMKRERSCPEKAVACKKTHIGSVRG
ncbi:hypothetical protein VTK26DRAFT_290 [Humicola hyalothermophila]